MDIGKNWELFPHGADMGIRGYGTSIIEAFTRAGMALTAVVSHPEKVKAVTEIAITCSATDYDLLFFDWINAIIYEMDSRKMLFSEFAVEIQGFELRAIIKGEKVDRDRHQPAVDVKGATFTELTVKQIDGLWIAQCVVDV